MKHLFWTVILAAPAFLGSAQNFAQTTTPAAPAGPTDSKAQKTFLDAGNYLKERNVIAAFESYKKADKQDGGNCLACQKKIIQLGEELGDYKAANNAALETIQHAQTPSAQIQAHYDRGILLLHEGNLKHEDSVYADADKEFKAVLAASAKESSAYYADGLVLAHLKQDDAAKAQFQQYIQLTPKNADGYARALRYIDRPELARARMAPPFVATTIDGKKVSIDDLTGKVVLIDFWATWCGPCREALPHIRTIAQKFSGEPLVVLSVSLDSDDQKWRDFVAKNQMTWLQVRDGGFTGDLAKSFAVNAIPHTFTIDTDGVLQDEHVGDASIEGKLKKLCADARKKQESTAKTLIAGQ